MYNYSGNTHDKIFNNQFEEIIYESVIKKKENCCFFFFVVLSPYM